MEVYDRNNPPITRTEKKYDVFISHSHKQEAYVKTLRKDLEAAGLKCCNVTEEFRPNKSVVINICEHIKLSKKVIVLLSKDFFKSNWGDFEVGQAIDQEVKTKKMTLIYILYDMDIEDIPPDTNIVRRNILLCSDNKFMEKLLCSVKEDIPADYVIAGEVADGLAWSYFYGYLKLVLPGMVDRIKNQQFLFVKDAKKYKCLEDIKHIPILPKMMIVLPDSGFCPPSLTSDDPKIVHVCHIPFRASRAGNVDRDYKSSVYCVQDNDGKNVLIVAEFATPLMSLHEMEIGKVAKFTKQNRINQKFKFHEKLEEILVHTESCQDAYCFYSFSDPRTPDMKPDGWSLSDLLYKKAIEELERMKKVDEVRLSMSKLQQEFSSVVNLK